MGSKFLKSSAQNFLCIALISLSGWANGQAKSESPSVYSFPIPKNIQQCFSVLDKTASQEEMQWIKILAEDSLPSNVRLKNVSNFFHAWNLYAGSDLTKYFHKKRLFGAYYMYKTILVSYHRYLNGRDIELEAQITWHQKEQEADAEIHLVRLSKERLNGFYIPLDINDCMKQLDDLMDQDEKGAFRIKEESFAVSTALLYYPGQWIKNNWGLWGGSRLQKYFMDQGVSDPEAMTWIILTCYYHYQNGGPIDIEKQVSSQKLREKNRF